MVNVYSYGFVVETPAGRTVYRWDDPRLTAEKEAELRAQLPAPVKRRKASKRKRNQPRPSGQPSARQNYAAAVVGRAMAELVERVNGGQDDND
jgi:hypothetical protein